MRTDIFTKVILSVIAVALVALVAQNNNLVPAVLAQDSVEKVPLYSESTAPKSWGHVVGTFNNRELVFEDSVGTIRFYFPGNKEKKYSDSDELKITPPLLILTVNRR